MWGKYAEQFEPFIDDNNVENLICLIRFAKISFYQGISILKMKYYLRIKFIFYFDIKVYLFVGEVQITNAFDASLVILNPTMKEAIEFKEA